MMSVAMKGAAVRGPVTMKAQRNNRCAVVVRANADDRNKVCDYLLIFA
jgi:hypothetical protein